jgi:UTP-glucose-1-phosphate uridylyltransferase
MSYFFLELRHKLENNMVRDNRSEENDNLNKVIHNIEIELVKIYNQKAKGAQIRCREKWVEYGEKITHIF